MSNTDKQLGLGPEVAINIHYVRLCDFHWTLEATPVLFIKHLDQVLDCPLHELPNLVLKAPKLFVLC
jgi:hypothetical protein